MTGKNVTTSNPQPRRGGPNGVTCLGNNEPDGKSYIANWNGASIGCCTKAEAEALVQQLRNLERVWSYR
jgi:hypothetical protein